MKVDDGFVSCRKLEGVFTCIAVNDITKTTIYLQNVYLSIETMKQDPNNLEILNFIKQVKLIENIDKLLYLECIKIIARNLSVDKYGSFLDNIINNHLAISSLNNFLINADADTTIISSNYGLKIWYPFQNNVSGITLYDNFRNTPLIKEIYMNMSYNMNTSGALLSAYVPGEVLYDLTYELSYSRKKEIKIIMLFIKMNNNLRNEFQVPHNVTYLIGIAIPKLCKMNYLPMIYASLTSYTNNLTLWSQFGANYFDRVTYSGYRCIFDQISYFGKADDYEYNSLRNAYCLVSTFDKISFKNISWVVPVDQPIFPPYLCVKKNYDIMSTYCLLDTPREIYVDYTCLDDFSVSNQTELLYQQYVACVYNRNECLNSFIYCHNFIDVLLQNNMLWMKGGSNLLGINNSSVIIKCLEKISLYVPDDQKVLYTSVLLELVDFSELHIPLDSAYKHIIIENVRMNDGAVYWKNTFEPLSNYSISDINFMPEPHVSALAFLEKYELFNSRIDFIVIDSIKLNYSGDCRSDIIGVKVMCEFCDFINFTIFLRITYGKYTNWGYWYWVTVEKGTMTLFCIAEQGHGKCSPDTELLIFQKPLETGEIINSSRFLRDFRSIGPDFSLFELENLLGISLVISIISLLGILNILSFLVYNKRCRKKFYTVQICFAQIFQLSPFLPLLSTFEPYIVYSAWFYGYLAELTWIFMYIYTKYMKFVGTVNCTSKLFLLIIGWLVPAIILVLSNQLDTLCWECNLCYQGESIFLQFIAVPFVLICFVNLIILVVTKIQIRIKILQKKTNIKIAKVRSASIISIFFAIWVPLLVIFASLLLFPRSLFYIYYCMLPSQGLVLFASLIFLEVRKKFKQNVQGELLN